MAAKFIIFSSKISSTVYILILAHLCYDTFLKTIYTNNNHSGRLRCSKANELSINFRNWSASTLKVLLVLFLAHFAFGLQSIGDFFDALKHGWRRLPFTIVISRHPGQRHNVGACDAQN